MDTGATDHITGELEKLTIRDKYSDNEQVHVANGTGMEIGYVGHSILHSPRTHIHLNNVLHVPQASKSLISVNRLARDNNAFFWNFIQIIFSSRNRGPRRRSLEVDVKEASTPYSRHQIGHHQINKSLVLSSYPCRCGILG